MKKKILGYVLGFCLLFSSLSAAEARSGSTIFGGKLLEEGEVAMTFGAGFPDVLYQFDFANSKTFNLALKARFNYSMGFSSYAVNGYVTAPLRIGIVQDSKLTFALKVEAGLFAGVLLDDTQGGNFSIGIPLEVGALFSLRVLDQLSVNFGVEIPMLLAINTTGLNDITTFIFSLEAMGGVEYFLNENFSLYLQVAIGPQFFIGELGRLFNRNKDFSNVSVGASGRFTAGLIWRR